MQRHTIIQKQTTFQREHAHGTHKETHNFKHGGGTQINVNIEEL